MLAAKMGFKRVSVSSWIATPRFSIIATNLDGNNMYTSFGRLFRERKPPHPFLFK